MSKTSWSTTDQRVSGSEEAGRAFLPRIRFYLPVMISSAKAVPSTRERILANAFSRVVEVSSQNGEKPQSSVVPSCSTGIYRAASRTRSRISSGLHSRIDGRNNTDEYPLSGLRHCRMIFSTRVRSGSPASAM